MGVGGAVRPTGGSVTGARVGRGVAGSRGTVTLGTLAVAGTSAEGACAAATVEGVSTVDGVSSGGSDDVVPVEIT